MPRAGETEYSAVSFAPIPDAGNLDGGLAFGIEEHPVVAAAEPEAGSRQVEKPRAQGSRSDGPAAAGPSGVP
jgi:hypothetical protein